MDKKYTISNKQKKDFKAMAVDLAEKAAIDAISKMEFPQIEGDAKELVNGLTPALLGCEAGHFPVYHNDICKAMEGGTINGRTALVIVKAMENISPAQCQGIEEWERLFKLMEPTHIEVSRRYMDIKEKEIEKLMKANPEYNTPSPSKFKA